MKVKEESEKVGLILSIQKTKILASGSHHSMANRWGNNGNSDRLYFFGLQNHCKWWLQGWWCRFHEIKRCLLLERKAMKNLHSMLKSRDITLLTKVHIVKAIFFGSHVQMWELDHKEGWALRNWCFWTVVLENTLLDCKEIQPVHPKVDQSWVFIGRTDTEALILRPPDA